jgi:Trk K+ transport system NAD-binding subunit
MVPDVRVVLRMFNTRLADAVREILPDCATLSSATLAAPAFVAGVLGDAVPTYVRLADRTLFVTRRDAVAAGDVLCGLSRPSARGEPVPLPEDQDLADVVLSTRAPIGSAPVRRRRRRHPLRAVSLLLSRRLGLVAAALLGLLVIGTAGLAATRDGGWWQAAYLTILTTFGGAEPDLTASGAEQAIQTALTVLSIALIPVLTAAVVDAAVNARLKRAAGGLQEPIQNHVVVAGLGDVGARVVRALDDFGVPVVAIDPSPHARGVQVARELDIPVIAGDAAREEALRGASVRTARGLIVLSTDDVTNLETALFARGLQPDLRVVLRLFDGDFADRVQRTFGITRSLSVSYLAAPAFAAAMLGRQVITTIPVGRRVLVLAELPLAEGCALEDRPVSAVRRPGDAWVIAVRTGRGAQTLWGPPAGRRLTRTDRLLVVATRRGLSRLLTEIAPPAA